MQNPLASSFDFCERETSRHEGGFSNVKADPGGATFQGVTQKTYDAARRRAGLALRPVIQMAEEERRALYRDQYWTPIRGDDLPPGLDLCVYDYAVNSGPTRAAKALQAALGDLNIDGHIGEITLAALQAKTRHGRVIGALCARRIAFMKQCRTAQGGPAWPVFGHGWARRVAAIYFVGCLRAGAVADRIFASATFGDDAVAYADRWVGRYHAGANPVAHPAPSAPPPAADPLPTAGEAKAQPEPAQETAKTDKMIATGGGVATILSTIAGAIDSPWAFAALAVVAVVAGVVIWRLWPRAALPELVS